MSDYIKAKAAFGELSLGEVCELVWHRCSHIRVHEEDLEKGTYNTFYKDERGLYLHMDKETINPDYSFDAAAKVKVLDDHVSLKVRGCEVSLHFLESRPIRLSSILPRRSK